MENPDKSFLQESLETINLDRLKYPEKIEDIIYDNKDKSVLQKENDFGSWLEDAEKWDSSPRKSVFINDYWSLDTELEEVLEEYLTEDIESPDLEGAKLARNAIEAQKEKIPTGFSTVIGLKVAKPEEKYNRSQLGAPQGVFRMTNEPEYFAGDDWYSIIEGEENVGLIVDDPTVFARHIRDNLRLMENSNNYFEDEFWTAYNEVLENFS